mgnify:FL=1
MHKIVNKPTDRLPASSTCASGVLPTTLSAGVLALLLVYCAQAQSTDSPLTADQWQEVRLGQDIPPNTFSFDATDATTNDKPVLRIESNASMSMMARAIDVDLARTPWLCWQWRVNRVLDRADMTERFGDDYAARLYVSMSIPETDQSLGLRLQLGLARSIWGDQVPDAAINYVWDNRQPVGTTLPNAYTDRVTMVVAQTGGEYVGQWVNQSRNLADDIETLMTPSATPVQIALAADTDNTGERVIAEFANIRFAAEEANCQ